MTSPRTIFCSFYHKKNRFYVAGGLPCSDKSQKTPKCGKNISDTLGCALCATFLCSYHALISVFCYCTDARQHEIYLLSCTYANHTSTSLNRLSFLLPSEHLTFKRFKSGHNNNNNNGLLTVYPSRGSLPVKNYNVKWKIAIYYKKKQKQKKLWSLQYKKQ